MICEIFKTKGDWNRSDAGRLINYITGRAKDHESTRDDQIDLVYYHNFLLPNPMNPGISPRNTDFSAFKADFEKIVAKNEMVSQPYKHIMISLAPGETLSLAKWKRLGREFMCEMGYDYCKYIITRHTDTEKEHIHILACTIQELDKYPVVNQWQEKVKATNLMRKLETQFDLQKVESPFAARNINNATRQPNKSAIRHIIDRTLKSRKDPIPLPLFTNLLRKAGVGVKFNFNNNRVSGISYSLNDHSYSGSKLGGSGRYSLTKLLDSGRITYIPDRDHKLCEKFNLKEQRNRESDVFTLYFSIPIKIISKIKKKIPINKIFRKNGSSYCYALLYVNCRSSGEKAMADICAALIRYYEELKMVQYIPDDYILTDVERAEPYSIQDIERFKNYTWNKNNIHKPDKLDLLW